MKSIPTNAGLVRDFMTEILDFKFPTQLVALTGDRKHWAEEALAEELAEFASSEAIEDQADALLDLIYFAYGRLFEMGLSVGQVNAAFQDVHNANMRKVRGQQTKQRGNMPEGFDAIKPTGWTGPDFWKAVMPIRESTCNPDEGLGHMSAAWEAGVTAHEARRVKVPTSPPPKVIVVGHGRHGKDTVCEILRDKYGFQFTSSSLFCAEEVCLPWFNKYDHLPSYETAEQCFEDRHGSTEAKYGEHEIFQHRAEWYNAITAYNTPDKARLGRAILGRYDIYNGLRNRAELWALQAAGVADYVIWVDRSDHVGPEDASSMTIEPWMADFHIDNNGSLAELEMNISRLVLRLKKEQANA